MGARRQLPDPRRGAARRDGRRQDAPGAPRRGDRADALDAPRVAIVGTRAATPMGIADAREIAAFCAGAGITVISGLAIGIDGAAHEGALDAGGLTVGVVATGLDVVYPRRHERLYARVREQGLIVGENGYGTQPLPRRFPVRNPSVPLAQNRRSAIRTSFRHPQDQRTGRRVTEPVLNRCGEGECDQCIRLITRVGSGGERTRASGQATAGIRRRAIDVRRRGLGTCWGLRLPT
jgi:hypothetical protein